MPSKEHASTDSERIVRYWHSVELLQPQSVPKIKKRNGDYADFIHDTPYACPTLPWERTSIVGKQALPDDCEWSHTLYAYLYDSHIVADTLQRAYGSEQGYSEPQHRQSSLFSLRFTATGALVEGSFVLSSEAWFLGQIGKKFARRFEEDQKTAADESVAQLQGEVYSDALRDFTEWVLQFLGVQSIFDSVDRGRMRFRSLPVRRNKPAQEDDPLNSFLLDDLSTVANNIGEGVTSEALSQYLRHHDSQQRLHIDSDEASLEIIKQLMPQSYAMGCWPSERHLGLVHSQQLAVNTVLSSLAGGRGIMGVNGPPGTGKTTLLRDLIAAIVTSRADVLASMDRASDGFMAGARETGYETGNDGGKEQAAFKLNPSLFGYEIVVASSNNGAVENVTLELPQRDKIDASWLPEAEHFADLGDALTGKPAWGLISGALGSKARRKAFVNSYFYGQASSEIQYFGQAKKTPPKGLLAWLGEHAQRNKNLAPQERQDLWQQAVFEYETAKAHVRSVCADASRICDLIRALQASRKKIPELVAVEQALEQSLVRARQQHAGWDVAQRRPAIASFKQALGALNRHLSCKPSLWENLCSLWGASRTWTAKLNLLQDQHSAAKAEFERVTRLAKQADDSRVKMEQQVAVTQKAQRQMREQEQSLTQQAFKLALAYKADHLLVWLRDGVIGRGDAIELAEPWVIEGWRQARGRVFIQALKLHRTFLELEAARIRSNLHLVNAMLGGTRMQGMSREAIRSVWASLFMVVPVLSSTFASFSRSFHSMGPEEIGWLLVDESGQSPPQAAVGALWRSRRALLVGDPLQLKPIVTVSDAALEHMRTHYRVNAHWIPNRQSAQTLADQATTWGRLAGPSDSKIWVGLPLVVHRRCDKPMYKLANRIAYDGSMVYGTIAPRADRETRASLPTGWIHSSGSSEGNWVPSEGKVLLTLIALLQQDGVATSDISIITPFKAVQANLERLLNGMMTCGTIHTMQGKEYPVVIMVLGGNTSGGGARNWVVSEPNLLNVAATRAKRRFYVIGDREDWKNRSLFRDVMHLLPTQSINQA